MMNSLITRGYDRFDRIITRGYGPGWMGRLRAEIIKVVSRFTRVVSSGSRFTKEMDGV